MYRIAAAITMKWQDEDYRAKISSPPTDEVKARSVKERRGEERREEDRRGKDRGRRREGKSEEGRRGTEGGEERK